MPCVGSLGCCREHQRGRLQSFAVRGLERIHMRDQGEDVEIIEARGKVAQFRAGFTPVQIQPAWVAALPMNQRGCRLDDALVEQPHFGVGLILPGVFPGFVRVPVVGFVEQCDPSYEMFRTLHDLVPWDRWIDLRRPGVDAARHVGEMLEASATERHADLGRASAMMTHNHEFFVAW